jgi:hypothetical protein
MSSSAITGPILSDTRRAPAGTAAAPSFAFNDSTGTGVYLVSAGVLGLSTNGVRQVVVDASGNVGIGTASPATKLTVYTGTAGNLAYFTDGVNTDFYIKTSSLVTTIGPNAGSTNMAFQTAGVERMRIDASGNLHTGRTGVSASAQGNTLGLITNGAGYNESVSTDAGGTLALWYMNRQSSNGTVIEFRRATAAVGSITVTASGTGFNPSSDRRLKYNIEPMVNGLERVMKLKPVTYRWKSNDAVDDGFIAQDLQAIPEFANRVNPIGEIEGETHYGVDYMRFVSILTAAIQEQQEIIGKLEARLAALEGK